jgi:hypothetical protein
MVLTSADPLSLLAGVVDVITALAALMLAVVLTARLRTSSGMSNVSRLEEKRNTFGMRYSTSARLSASEVPPVTSMGQPRLTRSLSASTVAATPSPSGSESVRHLFVHPSRLSQQ